VGWIDKAAKVFEVVGFTNRTPTADAFAGAVAGWQRAHGLKGDGMLGPNTWRAMEPSTKSAPKAPPPAIDWFKLTPKGPPTRGKLLVSEGDVTAGALVVNDAYDLALYEMSDGNYDLDLFMKIQFFFEDGDGGTWSSAEKNKFMQEWRVAVAGAWNNRRLHTTKNGKTVALSLRFAIQEGGWMLDHWELEVTKIKAGSFRTSYVNPRTGNVVLDSEDLRPTPKGYGQMQQGVVHEFGHMLGLLDEYLAGSPHIGDHSSVMNRGAGVRGRHQGGPRDWVIAKFKDYGIE
jgi:hypothetical protein